MERSAGVLTPVFSLPSDYGIGSMGKNAFAYLDFLKAAGQRWWQILPVGPTIANDSPYTSLSTFAGNPLLIDLEKLAEEGLLTPSELEAARVPESNQIDYGALHETRPALLRKAFSRISPETAQAARAFRSRHPWVRDYTLYLALKDYYKGLPWYEWPDEAIRRHDPNAVEKWHSELAKEVAYYTWEQYCFFEQWHELKQYANSLGLGIIGDLPIYVSLDSADVWSERVQFALDSKGKPVKVAGVPPDFFSEDGQLWGNPLYNWDVMRKDGFGWWIRRIEGASALFDVIRIDHFRAMESYWAIPADSKSAKIGQWEKGPGMDLLRVLTSWFHQLKYIAEDLGVLTDAVHELRNASGLPGMKVLEFAFSGPDNAYLPHNYIKNCVCYTGTHDNDTIKGWYDSASKEEKDYAKLYAGITDAESARIGLLRWGQGSVADLFVAQIQDYIGLGTEARINIPGVAEGNWKWRLQSDQITDELAAEIREMTWTYGRCDAKVYHAKPEKNETESEPDEVGEKDKISETGEEDKTSKTSEKG